MLKDVLLPIICKFNADGYFKFGSIPEKKLNNAIDAFPINKSDTILALIDTTVFGSAKNGLAIGLSGLYFRNDWTTKTEVNFLPWDVLSIQKAPVDGGAFGCIRLSDGNELNISGASIKKAQILQLLNELITAFRGYKAETSGPSEVIVDVSLSQPLPLPKTDNSEPESPPSGSLPVEASALKDFLFNRRIQQFNTDEFFFAPHLNPRKLQGALASYGVGIDPREVFFQIDDTAFGGAAEGLLLTNDILAAKSFMEKPVSYRISAIRNISCLDKTLVINGTSVLKFTQPEKASLSGFFELVNDFLKMRNEANPAQPKAQDVAVKAGADKVLDSKIPPRELRDTFYYRFKPEFQSILREKGLPEQVENFHLKLYDLALSIASNYSRSPHYCSDLSGLVNNDPFINCCMTLVYYYANKIVTAATGEGAHTILNPFFIPVFVYAAQENGLLKNKLALALNVEGVMAQAAESDIVKRFLSDIRTYAVRDHDRPDFEGVFRLFSRECVNSALIRLFGEDTYFHAMFDSESVEGTKMSAFNKYLYSNTSTLERQISTLLERAFT